MSEFPTPTDPWLDARLRNVPLPVGLLRRLEQVANPEINRMDRALADVPLPEGFLERLTEISRIERPSWARDLLERRPRAMLALAASLLLMAGGGYLAYSRGGPAPGDGNVAHHDRPGDLSAEQLANGQRDSGAGGATGLRDRVLPDRVKVAPDLTKPELDNQFVDDNGPHGGAPFDGDPPEFRLPPQPMPELPVAAPVRQSWETLGSGGRFDELPVLDEVQIESVHGITPPIVAEYDLLFQLRYGQHPIVQPGANPLLRSVQLPLVTSTAPWRRVARTVAEGRLPAPADVRTEDFLAALDYGFPPAPQGGLSIETAAGPAPLSEGAVSLLQVAVHAGEIAKEARAATHLTLVVDSSLAMRRSERWNSVGQALNALVEHMQPADRLTLIAFSEEPETVVDSKSQDELLRDGSGTLLRAIEAIEARPTANLAAGVQLACRLASRAAETGPDGAPAADGAAAPKDAPATIRAAASAGGAAAPAGGVAAPAEGTAAARRMLILSGGRVDSGDQLSQRVQGRLTELVGSGLVVNVVDLGRAERAAGSLDAWAQAGAARLARASDPNTLGWRLLEGLIGHEPVVAQHVTLRVSFNPDVVASYRLLGHERTSITGPAVAETEVDLRCGETATALFEVALKPGLKNDVAVVESTWRRPNYGKAESGKKQVVRSQFGVTFASSPASLQMAAVAAMTAETLRGSYFAPANRSLARIADLARQLSKPIQDEPTFRDLTQFIDQAERVRTHRAKPVVPKPAAEPTVKTDAAKSDAAK